MKKVKKTKADNAKVIGAVENDDGSKRTKLNNGGSIVRAINRMDLEGTDAYDNRDVDDFELEAQRAAERDSLYKMKIVDPVAQANFYKGAQGSGLNIQLPI